jgi:hypothetical protein
MKKEFDVFGYKFACYHGPACPESSIVSTCIIWFAKRGSSKRVISLYNKKNLKIIEVKNDGKSSFLRNMKYTYVIPLPFNIWFIHIDFNKYWFPVMFHCIREPRKK